LDVSFGDSSSQQQQDLEDSQKHQVHFSNRLCKMEAKRTLYFTSPGFRSQDIIIAPDLDDSTSKRKPLIETEVPLFFELLAPALSVTNKPINLS
jgi:hypothetical protein